MTRRDTQVDTLMRRRLFASALSRWGTSLVVGAVVALVAGFLGGWVWAVLWGFAVQGTVATLLVWMVQWPATADQTQAHARRDTFSPRMDELVLVLTVLCGVGATLVLGLVGSGPGQLGAAGLALTAVLMQWFSLHGMYSARYAFEYYDDGPGTAERMAGVAGAPPATREPGGIDFNDPEPPCYRDFMYFSYNLGMTYQVSDTNVTSSSVRAVVLRHCLLSYLFALVILATTVNLVTGIFAAGG